MHYRFDRFELRPIERQLLAGGEPVPLGARAFDVLLALIEHRDRLVSKGDLLDRVWGDLVVEEANVQVQISALRKALGPQAVATIPGRGYRFSLPLQAGAAAPSGRATPAAAAPVAGAPAGSLRTNLPDIPEALIGRADDVAALGALIGTQRLITLVGAGGVGKSRVAQWLLHERRGAFDHGVAWVDLAPVSDPALLADTLASALGLPILTAGVGDALQALLVALKPLRLLVAIDNAEHLIDDVARVARGIHESAPGVHMLVTSQAPLKLGIEWVYRLGPLAVPEAGVPAREALRYGAVALFAARTRAADRRFVLDEHSIAPVIDLCRRLDGLALAIELAAARVPLLGLQQLGAALEQRFRVLTSGHRDAAARHQTLRDALDWSVALLTPAERSVFRRLGVFNGSFSLDLALQVAADGTLDRWGVVDALGALAERSLVAVEGQDQPRYRLLETPRAFALEQLAAAGETELTLKRHALAVHALMEQAYADYFSGRHIDAWREALQPDFDNGREALHWALQHDAAMAVALAADLALAMSITQLHDARRVLEVSAARVADPLPPALQARWFVEAAHVWIAAQPARASALARRAAELYRGLGDRLGLYRSLGLRLSCNPDEPRAEQRAALAELQALEDPAWPPIVRARGAHAAAVLHISEGDTALALEWNHRRDALHEQAGNSAQRPMGQAMLMDIELSAGRVDDAIRRGVLLEQQLRDARHQAALPFVALNLAAAWLAKADAAKARALALAHWPMAQQVDMHTYWADYLALIAVQEGRPIAAARLLGFGDAGYAAKAYTREVNEARAAQQAEEIATRLLGRAEFERQRALGASLGDDEIAALAFAAHDAADPAARYTSSDAR